MSQNTNYTNEQLKVITHSGGHALVAAVAGSGKTETILGRVQYLLNEVTPDKIAVVMFNRDAKESFERRFTETKQHVAPEIRTFNSMGNKIVDRLVKEGHLPQAKIESKDYVRSKLGRVAFTQLFKKKKGNKVSPPKELVDGFMTFISLVKSDIYDVDTVFQEGNYGENASEYPDAFREYEKARKRAEIRFYEDQLYDSVMLLLNQKHLQKYVSNKLDYIIVDEAQDMNGIQIALVRILAGGRAEVMIVGDEDQAIYEWRGAKPSYLTGGFEEDFPGAIRYTLPHTFRFGHLLSLAASHLISHNKRRNPKISISAEGTPNTRIHCLELGLGQDGLGSYIKNVIEQNTPPGDIAVLIRTYSQSVALELDLRLLGVPFFVYGRPPLKKISEIAALLGVLYLASGRWSSLPPEKLGYFVKCLLNRPTLYLDQGSIDSVVRIVLREPRQFADALRSLITNETQNFQAQSIKDRADILEIYSQPSSSDLAVYAVENYLHVTNFEEVTRNSAATQQDADNILSNIEAFRQIASRHKGTIGEFLDEIDPMVDIATEDPPKYPHVWIGSIHRAKGAQWSTVFVPGLVAGVFPKNSSDVSILEAERRLFYVATTRATKHLYLAHPYDEKFRVVAENIKHPGFSVNTSPISSFVWEMNLAVSIHAGQAIESGANFESVEIDRPEIANQYFKQFPFAMNWNYGKRHQKAVAGNAQLPTLTPEYRMHSRVSHEVLGAGVVSDVSPFGIVLINFDNGDSKRFRSSDRQLSLAPELGF